MEIEFTPHHIPQRAIFQGQRLGELKEQGLAEGLLLSPRQAVHPAAALCVPELCEREHRNTQIQDSDEHI
jgi:hypothetical protein